MTNYFQKGITKPCTHLHAPPPSSIYLHPGHFSLHPALCNILNQNMTCNWAISSNFDQKIQICPFWLNIGSQGMLEVLILNTDLDFWNSNPKINFWANLGQKNQSCAFFLKIGTHGISRMLIPIPRLVFWISNSKFFFGQIWAKKVKVVHFALKLAHMVSSGSWFLFRHSFSEFQNLNSFLGKISPKKWNYPFLLKIDTQSIIRMMILIPTLVFSHFKPKSLGYSLLFWDYFWNSKPKSIFRHIWVKKVEFSILPRSL